MNRRLFPAALALVCALAGPAMAQSQAATYRGPSGTQVPASGVQTIGANTFAPNQVTIGATPTPIVGQTLGRGWLCLSNPGTAVIFLGGANVTTSGANVGYQLGAGTAGAAGCIPYNGALYGIVATGTQALSVAEIY